MIEFCTRRRMIFAIVGLIVVSMVVLFVEHRLSPSTDVLEAQDTTVRGNATYRCWEVAASVTMTQECVACNVFEQKSISICKETGYKEIVKCVMKDNTTSELYRSCPKITWIEEKNFWIFELLMGLMGLSSYSVVHIRQKRLDRLLVEKVNKQIAAGV